MNAIRGAALALAVLLCAVSVSACGHKSIQPTSPPRAAVEDPSLGCELCVVLMTAADAAVQNSTDMKSLEALLQQGCAALPGLSPLLCDTAVAAVVAGLPAVPSKLWHSGYYTPEILCSFMGQCSVECCTDNTPTQIHLSVGSVGVLSGEAMTVVWITKDDTADSLVQWGPSATSLTNSASAAVSTYTAGGWLGSIHTATMTGLSPAQPTFYRVGGPNSGWSEVAQFTSIGAELPAGFTFIQVGDMGAERNFSAGNQDYINYAASSKADPSIAIQAVLHVGDISYANGYMERWDELFNAMQPTASQMPYQTIVGNHEIYFNFSSYKARMAMPAVQSNATLEGALYYSWDAGCMHFVALNSEDSKESVDVEQDQVDWLQADLENFQARRLAGKAKREAEGSVDDGTCSFDAPTFLIVYIHRPLYCSVSGAEGLQRCTTEGAYLRGKLEALFLANKVDLVYCGHVHAYERMSGIVNGVSSPEGPQYILNGAGGNREGGVDGWSSTPADWSVVRIGDSAGQPGLGTLQLINSTTLLWNWYLQTDLADAVTEAGIPKPSDSTLILAK